jgi:predicted ATP-grasp superfamily ATP-dependent carboligase
MYTGGLENHPALVERISARRSLWGNGAKALAIARSPVPLANLFRSNEIPFPAVQDFLSDVPRQGRWLVKPRRGSGGTGIRFLSSSEFGVKSIRQAYFQQFIEGVPFSAVYVGLEQGARLLGITRQFVGETWLHARPFHYCGSIGPLQLESPVRNVVENVGNVLARECFLRGIFGVDFVLSKRIPWPVEVNPRYPASAEVLEYALDIKALSFHQAAFDSDVSEPAPVAHAPGSAPRLSFVGKAILFANRSFSFPREGPWMTSITALQAVQNLPDFADIPQPGQVIKAGRPILTFFSQCASLEDCGDRLKQTAQHLDQYLLKA